MNWQTILSGFTIGLAVYLAAALQIAMGAEQGPQWLLALAGCWLCIAPPHRGTLGVAGIGLCIDVMGHDRLGMHLAICGVLAALVRRCVPENLASRVWSYPLVTCWLVWGDVAISQTVLALGIGKRIDLPLISADALYVSGQTTGIVLAAMCLVDLTKRYIGQPATSRSPELTNQWSRLADG